MRIAVAVVCFVCAVLPAFAEKVQKPIERERAAVAGGLARTYTVIAPERAELLPLLIVYHGGGQNAARARRYTRFDEFAVPERFVAVYPQAINNNWNDGRHSPDIDERATADDVEFTVQIIEQLAAEGLVDRSRVFLTGASNGGMMALRAGCELGDRIAGIALVVANLPVDWECRARQMPALFIQGTDDAFMPFAGGEVAAGKTRRNLGSVRSVDETIAVFKKMNRCTGVKETKSLDIVGRDNTVAVITDYACAGAPLKQIVIQGGGHTWPGARDTVLAEWLLGNTSQEVSATAEIWNFFKALPGR